MFDFLVHENKKIKLVKRQTVFGLNLWPFLQISISKTLLQKILPLHTEKRY